MHEVGPGFQAYNTARGVVGAGPAFARRTSPSDRQSVVRHGRSLHVVGACSSPPALVQRPSVGLYEATVRCGDR